jgi:hypothetical protein
MADSPAAPTPESPPTRTGWFGRRLGWTRSSYAMLSAFIAIISLIMIVWWPLVHDYAASYDPAYPFWQQMDWLLLGIFLVMSLLVMAGADLKTDVWIVLVGMAGGLAIESWGTQTGLWSYFTHERPPLWIIPAWPIASLSIDRLVRFLKRLPWLPPKLERIAYWLVFGPFFALLVWFVRPTWDQPMTWIAVLAVVLIILSPTDYRMALLIFVAGSGLGYFLEVWGTTRACWTYYTLQTPPPFAVFAHGLAGVAFWRAGLIVDRYRLRLAKGITESMRLKKGANS